MNAIIRDSETVGCDIHVILYQPEIPPNTGNIIRLCANSGAHLHLVGPLGFFMDDARLKRAGLDYGDALKLELHVNWQEFREQRPNMRLWAFTTRGQMRHDQAEFRPGDGLLFGPESQGLPEDMLDQAGRCLKLPMVEGSRSLNLANAVAIGVYEAWRQLGFSTGR